MSDKTLFPMPEPPEPETPVTRFLLLHWCDEHTPEPQADPNAFLRQHEGRWLLVPVEDDIEDAGGNCIVVAHGDLIEFVSNRTYGQREITVESDGEYVLSEPFPNDANNFCFRAQDYESTMPTIPELIATSKDNAPHEWTPPYIAGIEAWFWGETTTFRVVIDEGAARLTRLPEPPFVAPYTNWRGETAIRRLRPIGVKFMATAWHREPQWILEAFDYDRQEMRGFALKDFGHMPPKPDSWWRMDDTLRNAVENYEKVKADLEAFDGDRRGHLEAFARAKANLIAAVDTTIHDEDDYGSEGWLSTALAAFIYSSLRGETKNG